MDFRDRKRLRLPVLLYSADDAVFSVTIGTDGRLPVFLDLELGFDCVAELARLSLERGNDVFAYCLMPDHVHLLVGVTGESPLPSFVGAWKSRCYQARRRRGQPRSFWQRSFYDHALRNSEDLMTAAVYILENPVRGGLVSDRRDYPLGGSLVWDL